MKLEKSLIQTFHLLPLFVLIFYFCQPIESSAQGIRCDEGVIRLPDSNGTIQICSALAGQVPNLAKQLAAATKTLGSQEQQLKELTRLIKGLNGISGGIGLERQFQMLKNLSNDLGRAQDIGPEKTTRVVENLSLQVQDLRDQMIAALSNNTTVSATNNALKGALGDAIAKLEFGSASRQIDDISRKLTVIQSDVTDIKSDTADIKQQLLRADAARLKREDDDKIFLDRMEKENAQRQVEAYKLRDQLIEKEKLAEQTRSQETKASMQKLSGFLDLLVTPHAPAGFMGPSAVTSVFVQAFFDANLSWQGANLMVVLRPQTSSPIRFDITKDVLPNAPRQSVKFLMDKDPAGTWAVCATALHPLGNKSITFVKFFDVKVSPGPKMPDVQTRDASPVQQFETDDPKNPCRITRH